MRTASIVWPPELREFGNDRTSMIGAARGGAYRRARLCGDIGLSTAELSLVAATGDFMWAQFVRESATASPSTAPCGMLCVFHRHGPP